MTDFILISILNTRFICCCSCAIKIHQFSSEMNTRTIQMENGITWTKWMKRRSGINRLSQKMMKILFNHHLFTVWNHWLSHIRWARGLLVQSHLLYLSKWINKFSPQLIYTAVMPFRRGDNLESGRLICGPEMVVVDSKTVPKTFTVRRFGNWWVLRPKSCHDRKVIDLEMIQNFADFLFSSIPLWQLEQVVSVLSFEKTMLVNHKTNKKYSLPMDYVCHFSELMELRFLRNSY